MNFVNGNLINMRILNSNLSNANLSAAYLYNTTIIDFNDEPGGIIYDILHKNIVRKFF
jgi:uncharacterized protein YjbI with pentapeptide repeats